MPTIEKKVNTIKFVKFKTNSKLDFRLIAGRAEWSSNCGSPTTESQQVVEEEPPSRSLSLEYFRKQEDLGNKSTFFT